MTNLNEVILSLCPNGVPKQSIGSLITRKRLKAKNYKGDTKVYAVTNSIGFVLSSELHEFQIHSEDTSNYSVVEKNDFAYNPSRLNIGSIAFYPNKESGLISPMYVVFSIDENIITPQFLYLNICSNYVKGKIESLKEEGARFRFDFSRWNKIEIPLPPLPIQQRIVEILEKFTSLVSSLDSEIALRQKQYEYYRNKLLSFEEGDEGVEWKKLGDFCSFQNGFAFKSNLFKDNGTPIVRITNITDNFIDLSDIRFFDKSDYRENLSPYKINKGEILVAMSGATTGKIGAFKSDKEVYINQRVGIFRPRLNVVSNEYLYYCLQIRVNDMYIMAGGGAQPNLSSKKLLETMFIPIVSKERQRTIVRTLDTFESLLTNLKKERELRQKQYEYYREKLLTFA